MAISIKKSHDCYIHWYESNRRNSKFEKSRQHLPALAAMIASYTICSTGPLHAYIGWCAQMEKWTVSYLIIVLPTLVDLFIKNWDVGKCLDSPLCRVEGDFGNPTLLPNLFKLALEFVVQSSKPWTNLIYAGGPVDLYGVLSMYNDGIWSKAPFEFLSIYNTNVNPTLITSPSLKPAWLG